MKYGKRGIKSAGYFDKKKTSLKKATKKINRIKNY